MASCRTRRGIVRSSQRRSFSDRPGDRKGQKVFRISGQHHGLHGGLSFLEMWWPDRFRSYLVRAVRIPAVAVRDRRVGYASGCPFARTAKSRMPSEWAKKVECWETMRDLSLDLTDPLPPELQAQTTKGTPDDTKPAKRNEGLSHEDLELIEQCRRVDATTWFKIAQWGTKSKAIHWKVVGIAKTVGEYAIGGWERSPSAKQAKRAMEAYKTAQEAGVVERIPTQ